MPQLSTTRAASFSSAFACAVQMAAAAAAADAKSTLPTATGDTAPTTYFHTAHLVPKEWGWTANALHYCPSYATIRREETFDERKARIEKTFGDGQSKLWLTTTVSTCTKCQAVSTKTIETLGVPRPNEPTSFKENVSQCRSCTPIETGHYGPSVYTGSRTDRRLAGDYRAVDQKSILTPTQKETWANTGCLFIPASEMWTDKELASLLAGVDKMDDWPDKAMEWMKYYETKGDNQLLQRIENFAQYNPPLDVLMRGKLQSISGELFGEPALLHKEKINYKMPGGAGFEPHQDIAAGWWAYGQTLHISALVTIDAATKENGCLEVVYGKHKDGKLGPDFKAIPTSVCDTLEWVTLPTKPGDCFFFDSYVPHRSGPNTTTGKRRVLYATYAKASEGDHRERYYADKRKSFPPDIERDPQKTYAYKI